MGLSAVIRQSWYAGHEMCDVVSKQANKKAREGVCVRTCCGVDKDLGWKKFFNHCLGFLPEFCTKNIQSISIGRLGPK